MFDQQVYHLKDQMNDSNQQDISTFLMSKSVGGKEQQRNFGPATTSPSLSSSQSLQPSISTMSHSSVISGTSASSSAMGSPFITMQQESEPQFDDWTKGSWGVVEPGILQNDHFPPTFANSHLDDSEQFQFSSEADRSISFVAPNVVQPYDVSFYPQAVGANFDGFMDFSTQMHPPTFPIQSPGPTRSSAYESPAISAVSSLGNPLANQTFSSHNGMSRQPSIGSMESVFSKGSPRSMTVGFDDDANERGRCPYPGCGRVFKDLRAHKLTHQSERPEKCPIEKCQYHIKGFARKYDQTRHTLTHYKGTMVCGFCPGSGSASEKSFNRADVFKRHLTSVHGVEQTPSNSRRKSPVATKKSPSKDENKEGKCSTCGTVFTSAQDFYNHLDDCVMKILEKPEFSESQNERHLLEVASDQNVKATLERNNLPVEVKTEIQASDDEDEEMEDDDDTTTDIKGSTHSHRSGKPSRGLTRSKGGVPTVSKGRRKRKDYPHSWGCGKDQMKMRKRVLCVFDGQRRLWKDEMMMDNEYEVRVPFPEDNDKYVTDLDYLTLKRAGAIHHATDEEKGQWLKDEEVTKLML